jgi:G3E family GTPase
MYQPISVTVVAGCNGTNGETFLEVTLKPLQGQRVIAIIPARGSQKARNRDGIVMMPTTERHKRLGQGCSCCTVRSDLMIKIKRIAAEQSADHIVIHLAPKSDLDTLNKTFNVADADGFRLRDIARLESIITIVDASSVLLQLKSNASRALFERIEYASVLAFENTAGMKPDTYIQTLKELKAINPGARIYEDGQPTAH